MSLNNKKEKERKHRVYQHKGVSLGGFTPTPQLVTMLQAMGQQQGQQTGPRWSDMETAPHGRALVVPGLSTPNANYMAVGT